MNRFQTHDTRSCDPARGRPDGAGASARVRILQSFYGNVGRSGDRILAAAEQAGVAGLVVVPPAEAYASWGLILGLRRGGVFVVNAHLSVTADAERGVIRSHNLAGVTRGSEKAGEVVVPTAHIDHLGIQAGEIHRGYCRGPGRNARRLSMRRSSFRCRFQPLPVEGASVLIKWPART